MGGKRLNRPIVGMADTAGAVGTGWWRLTAASSASERPVLRIDGAMRLNEPIVGMAATPDGGGYWLVASDGGIFTSATPGSRVDGRIASQQAHRRHGGHSRREGLLAGGLRRRHFQLRRRRLLRLDAAIRSTSPSSAWPATPDGRGYWLVASDGGIFSFGDAAF